MKLFLPDLILILKVLSELVMLWPFRLSVHKRRLLLHNRVGTHSVLALQQSETPGQHRNFNMRQDYRHFSIH